MPIIAPSLLAANFLSLDSEIKMINSSDAEWLHIDIMDGVFVPNISYGFPVLDAIKDLNKKVMDVHLMISKPENYIKNFVESGAEIITVHAETVTHIHRTIQEIKSFGIKAGLALNPATPISVLEDIIGDLDLVLIMSVNPGFGGQKFIDRTYSKIEKTKDLILKNNLKTLIEVDGGVNLENAPKLVQAGADVLVAGSFVFSSENPIQTIHRLKNL